MGAVSPYPGGPRGVLQSALLGGRLYVFGGSHTVQEMRSTNVELSAEYGLRAPYGGVPNRRDDQALYVVGGRGSGSRVLKLSQDASGFWKWTDLPPLPPEEGKGRWVGTVGIDAGKWVILVGGSPTGTSYENRTRPQLADYRLRMDHPDLAWER